MPRARTTDETESTTLETDTETDTETETDDEETPEESARLALKELTEGTDESSQGSEAQASEESGGSAQGQAGTNQKPKIVRDANGQPAGAADPAAQGHEKPEESDPSDFEPPARLSPNEKAIFNKLPKAFRPAVARMFKEHQRNETKRATDYANATRAAQAKEQEAGHIIQAIRPYYTSNPDFAANGITESQVVAALVGAHQKLTDPKRAKQALIDLAADCGYRVQLLNTDGTVPDGDAGSNASDIRHNPEFRALQSKLDALTSSVEGERTRAAASPIEAEFRSIADQKDSAGNFLHPEMQVDNFWHQARPRISALVKSGYSYGDALCLAYTAMTGKEARKPLQQQTQARPPASNPQNNRAVQAAVSVRGRAAPGSGSRVVESVDVGDDETPEQSAMIALQELRRGFN